MHQQHKVAADQGIAISQPGMHDEQAGSYFPDSRVASNANPTSFVSPLSYAGGGPHGHPLDILSLPRGGESPWIIIPQSEEQGVGRSPGQQWPWQTITEAYNFDALAYVPFEWEQTGPTAIPGGWAESTDGRTAPERVRGMPGSTLYYENAEGYATDPNSVAVLQDPQQVAYTIGWGSLDNPEALDYGY